MSSTWGLKLTSSGWHLFAYHFGEVQLTLLPDLAVFACCISFHPGLRYNHFVFLSSCSSVGQSVGLISLKFFPIRGSNENVFRVFAHRPLQSVCAQILTVDAVENYPDRFVALPCINPHQSKAGRDVPMASVCPTIRSSSLQRFQKLGSLAHPLSSASFPSGSSVHLTFIYHMKTLYAYLR